jgi:DNA-binding response OmpR family regulator
MNKILVVEDDETLREVYALKLSMEGFTVETAADGRQALVVAQQASPDVIILDMMMPVMDGIEFLRRFATDRTLTAKVLVASNKTISEEINEAKRLGASDYLVKSQITPDELVAQVRRLLEL